MNIVTVPFHDYKKWLAEGFRTRDAHVFEHLERSPGVEKILVINRPVSAVELLIKRQSWHIKEGEVVYKRGGVQLTRVGKKSYCIDFFLPDVMKVVRQRKTWWFTAFQYSKVIDAINESLDYLGMDKSVLILQNPMAIGASTGLKCERFVFDAIDNWLYHPQMTNKELIRENYNYVDMNADLIMTVSKSLVDLFPNNRNVHWIPNGVDVEYFKDAFKDRKTDKTVVGYVGKIQDRVDFELVEDCLKKYPDFDFVFAGPVLSQQDRVNSLKRQYGNIRFLGDVHYSELPKAMKEFDIAIIPHEVDSFTESMNPLKLYEYLAAGKPIVTTPVAGTADISPYVYTADSSDGFVRILGETAKEFSENRVAPKTIADSIPEECRWDYRVACMIKEMEKI